MAIWPDWRLEPGEIRDVVLEPELIAALIYIRH